MVTILFMSTGLVTDHTHAMALAHIGTPAPVSAQAIILNKTK
jgi:hypothetical protein